MPNMPCKRACQTCLAKGLLLCKQACLVTWFFALQSRMPCERASSSTASAYIYIYISICPQSGMEKRCWTVCMHRFLAFLALKCNLLSIPAYLWSHFVFLSHFLAQTKHSHLFLFFGHQLEKLFASLAKGINPNSDKSTLQSLEKGFAAKP